MQGRPGGEHRVASLGNDAAPVTDLKRFSRVEERALADVEKPHRLHPELEKLPCASGKPTFSLAAAG